MAHFNADAARRRLVYGPRRAPITFTLAGERFTVVPEPMFGDVLDLAEAPEITPETEEQAVIALARFIELLLPEEDRPRFRSALRRIPGSDAPALIELGVWIVERVTGNPTKPPVNSQGGRSRSGGSAKRTTGGRTRSR